ncbi:ArgS-related anticodon-binding protein NrtL [Streptomyces sp. NPDC006670]|uniref:ArgS-related anticodon-binding protein NrtL n=1 Tax=Streptomyces sp. NPDC006670 TaxID=3154476 RepID=UPI0034096DA0
MIPADLSRAVVRAVRRAVEAGELDGPAPGRVVVERTRPGGVGEYASPVALRMGRGAEGARVLAKALALEPGVATVDVTGPGFLNFTLAPLSATELLRDLSERPERYGCGPALGEAVRGGREQVVRGAVARIREGQGFPREEGEAKVAPVARRDGDVFARYGAAAAVWAMVVVPGRETPVFGDGLLAQTEENEGFRVRYAHARARALARNARDLGFHAEPGDIAAPGDVAGPGDPAAPGVADAPSVAGEPSAVAAPGIAAEPSDVAASGMAAAPSVAASGNAAASGDAAGPSGGAAALRDPAAPAAAVLLRALADHPLALEAAAYHRAPERLARHLVGVADALLDFQYQVLPLGDEKPSAAHRARLALAEAAGAVLAGGLALLGIDAPDSL